MAPDYPADWHPLSNDAADSSWRGSPMSMFAKGGRVGAKPFEIRVPKEHIEKMAKGGLAGQAKNVANAGVGGDTMVIHINKDEWWCHLQQQLSVFLHHDVQIKDRSKSFLA